MTITEAKAQAFQASLTSPEDTFYVMKKNGKATFSRIEWVIRQRILDGWGPVCTYKAGREKY